MCGIAGWRSTGRPERSTLQKMSKCISHRGPDSDGIFVDGHIGLAFRRLAIIDLSPAGNQPMTSSTGKSTIIFNGEIYNFQELRKLVPEYKFKSGTDTETIMALYEKFGEACVTKLRGMFAFALWDHEKKSLFIARDRLGKKPVLYFYDGEDLLFASEIKALLAHPKLENRTVDQEAVQLYLRFGYVPGPLSIYKEVKKLQPGHTLTLTKDGVLKIKEYWDLDFNTKTTLGYDAARFQVRKLIEESVRLRLMSDVPLGAFLSGGIDSSTVVAFMARASETPIKTFSVGFGEAKYNELEYAKLVAEKYQTDHQEIMLTPDFIKDMPQIMSFFDEPFADASAIPTYYIARETRKHVTVALNGDGGDEAFAGYARYVHGMRFGNVRLPPLAQQSIPRTGFMRKLELLGMNNQRRYYSLHNAFEQHQIASPIEPFGQYYQKPKQLLDKWTYTDIKSYLPDDLLVKVDIATMANSLEGRSPLLDHRLVEFAASLPPQWKLKGGNTKIIFKDAVKDLLPKEILTKPKQGFAVPINEWMKGELGSYTQETIAKSKLVQQHLPGTADQLLALQKQGKQYGYRLWNLLQLAEWEKRNLE